MGEVGLKVGHEMCSAGMEATVCSWDVLWDCQTVLRKRRRWSPPASWVSEGCSKIKGVCAP